MGIQIECEECGNDQDTGANVFCEGCYKELEGKISDLEEEISGLNSDVASLEKELAAKE